VCYISPYHTARVVWRQARSFCCAFSRNRDTYTPRRHCSSGNTRDRVSSIQGGENIHLEVMVVQGDLTRRRTKKSEKAHTVSFNFRYRCGFLFLRYYIMYVYIYILLILSETVRQRERKVYLCGEIDRNLEEC